MVINLNLSGNQLLVYALIYGLTSHNGIFYGSQEYIATWCNSSRRTIITCLNELEKKGLILKKRTSKGIFYASAPVDTKLPDNLKEDVESDKTFDNIFSDVKNLHTECEKTSQCDVKNLHSVCEKTSHNILDNKLVNKLDNTSSGKATKKKTKADYELFLKSLESEDTEVYKKCAETFSAFKRSINLQFSPSNATLLKWQYDFALYSQKQNVSPKDLYDVLIFAINDSFWKQCLYTPQNLFNSFEKIRQRKHFSKNNSSAHKRFDGSEVPNFLTDYLGVANG